MLLVPDLDVSRFNEVPEPNQKVHSAPQAVHNSKDDSQNKIFRGEEANPTALFDILIKQNQLKEPDGYNNDGFQGQKRDVDHVLLDHESPGLIAGYKMVVQDPASHNDGHYGEK